MIGPHNGTENKQSPSTIFSIEIDNYHNIRHVYDICIILATKGFPANTVYTENLSEEVRNFCISSPYRSANVRPKHE